MSRRLPEPRKLARDIASQVLVLFLLGLSLFAVSGIIHIVSFCLKRFMGFSLPEIVLKGLYVSECVVFCLFAAVGAMLHFTELGGVIHRLIKPEPADGRDTEIAVSAVVTVHKDGVTTHLEEYHGSISDQ